MPQSLRSAFIATLSTATFTLVPAPSSAAINDVFPSDYVALPRGIITSTVYLQDRHASGPYVNRDKISGGHARNQVAALRVAQVLDIKGLKVSPLAVISMGKLQIEPISLESILAPNHYGFGDLRLGATIWLIEDGLASHYLGITGTLILPTGTYHENQVINFGENRYRYVLGAGWIYPLGSSGIKIDISPELAWYGSNSDYLGNKSLEQRPTQSLTAYLRYRLTPASQIYIGWQGNWGGATKIDNEDQHNAPETRRLMAGLTWLTSKHNQFIFRLARDNSIENGLKLDNEISLRWLTIY